MQYKKAMEWLDYIWGDRSGYAHVARKPGPENDRQPFITTAIEWPTGRSAVWAFLKQYGSTSGMFYVPALNRTQELRAKTAVEYRWFWWEADLPTPQALTTWPCWRTTSGRPGHHHGMQELSEPIGWAEWDRAQSMLGAFLGTEQKQSATRFLRIPGSVNRKAILESPRSVKLIRPAGDVLDVSAFRASVREHGVSTVPRTVPSRQRATEGSLRVPGRVRAALMDDGFSQSHIGVYRATRDLVKAGWSTVDSIVEVIDGSPLHGAKLASDPAYQLDRDVEGMLAKFGVTS